MIVGDGGNQLANFDIDNGNVVLGKSDGNVTIRGDLNVLGTQNHVTLTTSDWVNKDACVDFGVYDTHANESAPGCYCINWGRGGDFSNTTNQWTNMTPQDILSQFVMLVML